MKKLIYLLLVLPLFMASCSNDEVIQNEEIVQVSFSADISRRIGTRSETEVLSVNKVVCAVFDEKDNCKEVLREKKDIVAGQPIVFEPRLIKGRSYYVSFWAMKDENYNVDDMRNIFRKESSTESDYDAFTASRKVENILNATSLNVELTRPLAQLNIGITVDDWNAVCGEPLYKEPKSVEISNLGSSSFDAMLGQAVGDDVVRTFDVSGDEFEINGQNFKSLAKCYLFPTGETQDLSIKVNDDKGEEIRTVDVTFVPFKKNYKTNLSGSFMTGTVCFNVTLEDTAFDGDENNDIEI